VNVIPLIALFVALGGTSYGLASGAIGSREIKNNTVRSKDIRNGQILSKDVRNGSLLSKDFKAGQLPREPAGATGPPGRSALSALQSGETIRGVWAVSADGAGANSNATAVSFPVPAPQQVDSFHAVVAFNDIIDGAGCSGSAGAPVAAPGFACVYVSASAGTLNAAGAFGIRSPAFADSGAIGDGSPDGFAVLPQGIGPWRAYGTWACTAP
jgi:hypothetical protein